MPRRPFRAGLGGETLGAAWQRLIERYPGVMPGNAMARPGQGPPRFAILAREAWPDSGCLDLLLADQFGIPTLVEVKLAANPEARRAVIGQKIEYAAHFTATRDVATIRQRTYAYWHDHGKDAGSAPRERFRADYEDPDSYWALMEEQLDRGWIRRIIAADQVRPEARRVSEYLNAEFHREEIFGLEIAVYDSPSAGYVLVPNIIGQSQVAVAHNRAGPGPAAGLRIP